MSFRASHLKSILDNLGNEEYTRIVNAARYNDQTQLGQLVSEMDPRDFDFAIHFVNKIKERFNNNVSIYKQFLDILSTYRRDKRTIISIYNKVKDLFGSQPDLFEEFQKFLPDPTLGTTTPQEEDAIHHPTFVTPEEIAFFERVQTVVGSKQVYDEFLKVINLYNQDIINKSILVERVAHFLSKSPDLFNWFRNYINYKPQSNIRHIVNTFQAHGITLDEPFTGTNLKERFQKDLLGLGRKNVDLWQVSGSYRLMPDSEKKSPSSGRDPLANSVLNDLWVSHPTWASEGESFSVHHKNSNEETLHATEDEKFELDMKILTNQVAIKVLTTILNDIKQLPADELDRFELNKSDFPTTLYKKAIRQIYDDIRGEEMINAIFKKPSIAIPIVVHKLQERHEEWSKDRREFDRVWRNAFKLNFWKALDYQGASFKKQDKTIFTPKSLLLEIQQLHASKVLQFNNTSIPDQQQDLVFTIQNRSILNKVLNLLELYKNCCSTSDFKKFTKIMNQFIIPFYDNKLPLIYIPSALYIAIKLINLMYTRLLKLSTLQTVTPLHPNPVATHLNYPCVPSASQLNIEDRFDVIIDHLNNYVQQFEDANTFEEYCRNCYGLDGYLLFTIDKMLNTLVKSVVVVDVDEWVHVWQQGNDGMYQQCMALTTEYLFKVTVSTDMNQVACQLIINQQPEQQQDVRNAGKDVDQEQPEEEWETYVDNFLQGNQTEPIDLKQQPYLTRNLKQAPMDNIELKNGQKYKFKLNSRLLDKIQDSEDVFIRIREIGKESVDYEGFERKMDELLQEAGRKYEIDQEELWYDMEEQDETTNIAAEEYDEDADRDDMDDDEEMMETGNPDTDE